MGNEFAKFDGGIVYQLNNSVAGTYYLCIPEKLDDSYKIFVELPNKNIKDIPKQDAIEQVKEASKVVQLYSGNGIVIHFDIPVEELEQAAKENDNHAFNRLMGKIIPGIAEGCHKIESINNKQDNTNQLIYFIKQNETDKKFVNWLETNIQYGKFARGVTYDQIKEYYFAMIDKSQNFTQPLNKVTTDEISSEDMMKYINESTNNQEMMMSRKQDEKTENKAIGIAPIDHSMDYNDPELAKQNRLVRRLVPKKNSNLQGFVKFSTLFGIVSICLIVGITVACLIMNK